MANFYPRPPRGGRRLLYDYYTLADLFLSTPSARRATPFTTVIFSALKTFLSTPSARRATVASTPSCAPSVFLSTPSARRATKPYGARAAIPSISIHALREEGDQEIYAQGTEVDISIHALREEGDILMVQISFCLLQFLSTPSARRATHTTAACSPKALRFLSTPSARRATLQHGQIILAEIISIHALREEGDTKYRYFAF